MTEPLPLLQRAESAERATTTPPDLVRALLDDGRWSWSTIESALTARLDAADLARIAAAALPHAPRTDRERCVRLVTGLAESKRWDPFTLPLVADDLTDGERTLLFDALQAANRVFDLARVADRLDAQRWSSLWRSGRGKLSDRAALCLHAPAAEANEARAAFFDESRTIALDITSHVHTPAVVALLERVDAPTRRAFVQRILVDSNQTDSAGIAVLMFGHLVDDSLHSLGRAMVETGTRTPAQRALRLLSLARGATTGRRDLIDEAETILTAELHRDADDWCNQLLNALLLRAGMDDDGAPAWQRRSTEVMAARAALEDEDTYEPIDWQHLLPLVPSAERANALDALGQVADADLRLEGLAAAIRRWPDAETGAILDLTERTVRDRESKRWLPAFADLLPLLPPEQGAPLLERCLQWIGSIDSSERAPFLNPLASATLELREPTAMPIARLLTVFPTDAILGLTSWQSALAGDQAERTNWLAARDRRRSACGEVLAERPEPATLSLDDLLLVLSHQPMNPQQRLATATWLVDRLTMPPAT